MRSRNPLRLIEVLSRYLFCSRNSDFETNYKIIHVLDFPSSPPPPPPPAAFSAKKKKKKGKWVFPVTFSCSHSLFKKCCFCYKDIMCVWPSENWKCFCYLSGKMEYATTVHTISTCKYMKYQLIPHFLKDQTHWTTLPGKFQ